MAVQEPQKSNDRAVLKVGAAFIAAHSVVQFALHHDDQPVHKNSPTTTDYSEYRLDESELSSFTMPLPELQEPLPLPLPPLTFDPLLNHTWPMSNGLHDSQAGGFGSSSLFDNGILFQTDMDDAVVKEEIQLLLETLKTETLTEALVTEDGLLQDGVAESLRAIIARQNLPEVTWEVFGVVDIQDGQPDFSILTTQYSEDLAGALKSFESGSNESVPVLRQAIADYKEIHGSYLAEDSVLFLIVDYIDKDLAMMPVLGSQWNADKRSYVAETFRKMITESFTVLKGADIPAEQRGYEAIFHVHPNGSDPSPPDISANLDNHIPDLVISPQTHGPVKLFLVSGGAASLLFEGSLD